jgi:hypothetical protein
MPVLTDSEGKSPQISSMIDFRQGLRGTMGMEDGLQLRSLAHR